MKITNLEKTLGNFHLSIKNLDIELGIIHGFIGGNGSGKSTLAKLIVGLLEEDKGTIDRRGLTSKEITMTTQRPYLIRDTVYENIVYPLKIRKITIDKKIESEIESYLKLFKILDKKDQYSLSLSSGERQKASLIRALIFNPELLIIDESLSNMDLDSTEKMERIIIDRQLKQGKTCILISHQMSHINRVCQKVHFFDKGEIIESGSVGYIFQDCNNPIVRKYIDSQRIEVKNK